MLGAMLTALAVLRTLFLVFIVAFTVRAMPWDLQITRTFDEQYARYASAVSSLQHAAWYAIVWIAFDTVASWFLVNRARRHARAAPPAAAPPPAAPPPTPPAVRG
jgi:hypothetical protein